MNKLEDFVGIDKGCTKMLMFTEYNGVYYENKVPTGMNVTKEYLIKEVNKFIDNLPFKPKGIGMGVVGLVEGNEIKSSNLKNLEGLKTEMFERENCKCYFLNDVRAGMVFESSQYTNNENIVLVMAGSGFAISAREKGKHILGKNGWAGELGSNVYIINDKIETLNNISGGVGILEKANCNIEQFLVDLDNDKKYAVDLVKQGGKYFGLALVDIMHMFNPEYIIVGGSTATFKYYMEEALQIAKKYTYPTIFNSCKIVEPKDRKRIVALGARLYAYNKANGIEII